MSTYASKNLFDLLGNDQDEEGQPQIPVQPIEKPAARKGKREAPAEAPVKETSSAPRGGDRGRGGRGRGRGDATGSERAYQDRTAGRSANRERPADDGLREDRHSNQLRGGRIQNRTEGRGGRGGAGGRGGRGGRDDRHSRTGQTDSQKQVESGWGEVTGPAEWNDEQAGQQIAIAEEKAENADWQPTDGEGFVPTTEGGEGAANAGAFKNEANSGLPEAEQEPEDKSKSYEDYLAEQVEKRLALGGVPQARKANEGSKKQAEGKAFERDESEYFAGTGGKTKREREKKDKNQLLLDHDFGARDRDAGGRGGRGGRGRGRGEGGFRGDGRGRGEGSFRGEGRGRGRARGDDFRGGRGGRGGAAINVSDTSAFPTLGGS